MAAGLWTVWRHGNRRTDRWRVAYAGERALAERRYEREYTRMRQGGLRLTDPDGRVVRADWAPMVRTRW